MGVSEVPGFDVDGVSPGSIEKLEVVLLAVADLRSRPAEFGLEPVTEACAKFLLAPLACQEPVGLHILNDPHQLSVRVAWVRHWPRCPGESTSGMAKAVRAGGGAASGRTSTELGT